MTTLPSVGVIVVNWNTRASLDGALRSLSPTDLPHPLKIVVVDNASTDDSVEWVRSRHPQVHLIANSKNLGFGAAVNQAAALAQQPYLLIMNADVLCSPSAIAALAAFLDGHPKAGCAGPQLLNPDGTLQLSWGKDPALLNEFIQRHWWRRLEQEKGQRRLRQVAGLSQKVDWVLGACFLIRKSAFDQIGRMNESYFMYFEEADLFRRLRKKGWEIWYLPGAQAIHEGKASTSQSSSEMAKSYRESQIRYYRSHQGILQTVGLQVYLAAKKIFGKNCHGPLPFLRSKTGASPPTRLKTFRAGPVAALRRLRCDCVAPVADCAGIHSVVRRRAAARTARACCPKRYRQAKVANASCPGPRGRISQKQILALGASSPGRALSGPALHAASGTRLGHRVR
ncbi:MAG: glycosyltransferase family 2 protein, partial [Candidatus Omnitrophica bacterium]|nr:glycosyltransferase family 2 protein [Candidatus Omnitrophota bacterium]